MHQNQIDLLETVECVQSLRCCRHSRNGVEREQGLASKVVGRQYVVIHDGEEEHCRFLSALFQRHRTVGKKRPINLEQTTTGVSSIRIAQVKVKGNEMTTLTIRNTRQRRGGDCAA